MDNQKVSSVGDVREEELYTLLVSRFGKNCVYRSPKVYPHGEEKELADVMVLALPYAIVFQSKWKQATAEELSGNNGEIKRARLLRTLQKAAGQFKELSSSIRQDMNVCLPQIWAEGKGATFEPPLRLIKRIVPVVVVDFQDLNYEDPDMRFTEVPPVVTEVPAQVDSWGRVHSFLLKDLTRILQHVFTVGDLLLWLNERAQLFGKRMKLFWGYNELTLYALFMANYPRWKEFMSYDVISLEDNNLYERLLQDKEREFAVRKRLFGSAGEIRVVEELMIATINEMAKQDDRQSAILMYLECWGRILCCTCMDRIEVSKRLRINYEAVAASSRQGVLKTSCGIQDSRTPLGRTLLCIGVADYKEGTAEAYAAYAYQRMLGNIKGQGLSDHVDEALVILIRSDRPSVTCLLKTELKSDLRECMSQEELECTRFSFSRDNIKMSEWDLVKSVMGSD